MDKDLDLEYGYEEEKKKSLLDLIMEYLEKKKSSAKPELKQVE
jgi:hypothetical protein